MHAHQLYSSALQKTDRGRFETCIALNAIRSPVLNLNFNIFSIRHGLDERHTKTKSTPEPCVPQDCPFRRCEPLTWIAVRSNLIACEGSSGYIRRPGTIIVFKCVPNRENQKREEEAAKIVALKSQNGRISSRQPCNIALKTLPSPGRSVLFAAGAVLKARVKNRRLDARSSVFNQKFTLILYSEDKFESAVWL